MKLRLSMALGVLCLAGSMSAATAPSSLAGQETPARIIGTWSVEPGSISRSFRPYGTYEEIRTDSTGLRTTTTGAWSLTGSVLILIPRAYAYEPATRVTFTTRAMNDATIGVAQRWLLTWYDDNRFDAQFGITKWVHTREQPLTRGPYIPDTTPPRTEIPPASDPLAGREAFNGAVCRGRPGEGGFIVSVAPGAKSCVVELLDLGELSGNYRVEVSVRIRQGPLDADIGLAFAKMSDGYAEIAFTGNGGQAVTGFRERGLTAVSIGDGDARVNTGYGAQNRLGVEVEGDLVRSYYNGASTGTVLRGPRTLNGGLGLVLHAPGMEALFSNLQITRLTAR